MIAGGMRFLFIADLYGGFFVNSVFVNSVALVHPESAVRKKRSEKKDENQNIAKNPRPDARRNGLRLRADELVQFHPELENHTKKREYRYAGAGEKRKFDVSDPRRHSDGTEIDTPDHNGKQQRNERRSENHASNTACVDFPSQKTVKRKAAERCDRQRDPDKNPEKAPLRESFKKDGNWEEFHTKAKQNEQIANEREAVQPASFLQPDAASEREKSLSEEKDAQQKQQNRTFPAFREQRSKRGMESEEFRLHVHDPEHRKQRGGNPPVYPLQHASSVPRIEFRVVRFHENFPFAAIQTCILTLQQIFRKFGKKLPDKLVISEVPHPVKSVRWEIFEFLKKKSSNSIARTEKHTKSCLWVGFIVTPFRILTFRTVVGASHHGSQSLCENCNSSVYRYKWNDGSFEKIVRR